MVRSLLVVLAVFWFQGEVPKPTSTHVDLAGKWVSTMVPGRGEAPAIAPSFTIEEKGNDFVVTLQNDKERYVATRFAKSRTESILVLKAPATASGSKMFIIRPEGSDRVRFELFNEFSEQQRRTNFYYAEVFKKEK